jgi:hypothetical protein
MGKHDPQGRTDRLETLLETALHLKHTGTCHVERGKGGVRQFGKLLFLDGQLVDASSDAYQGMEAWEWLKTWSYCQYTFVSRPREEITIPVQPVPQTDEPTITNSPFDVLSHVIERVTQSISENVAPVLKSSGNTLDAVVSKPSDPVTLPPVAPSPELLHPNQVPHYYSPGTDTSINTPSGDDVVYTPPIGQGSSRASYKHQWHAQPPLSPPSPLTSVPSRLLDGDEALYFIEKYQLSRHHRHIFFLLDGQRTTMDVVRLTRRPLYEVQHVLEELEQFGLIVTQR